MFRTYLKIAWRKLSKNRLYTAVNLIGLTAGITSCILIALFVMNEKGYDRFHSKSDRIARITMAYGEPGSLEKTSLTGTKAGPQLMRTFPEIQSFARVYNTSPVVKSNNNLFRETRFLYADSSFLGIFDFPLLAGNKLTALDAPKKVLLTPAMATKYFGSENVVGKTINLDNKSDFEVTGIIAEAPENSQIKYDFIASFSSTNASKSEQWWSANYITYLELKPSTTVAALQAKLNSYMAVVSRDELKMETGKLEYNLEPLTDVHLKSELGGLEVNGNIRTIYIISIVSILILVIACINYTNLSTVQSSARGAEIGIRKVLGAQRSQLFGQFIGESMILVFFSLVLAVICCVLLMPAFNSLTGKELDLLSLLQPVPVTIAILSCVLIGFIAGSYPALLLANAKLISTLKSGMRLTSSGGLFRKSLIVFQFAVSVGLIICTIVIIQQLDYMRSKDIGYNRENVIEIPLGWQSADQYESLAAAIRRNPAVIAVTGGNSSPSYAAWGDGFGTDAGNGKKGINLTAIPSDLGYIQTMGMTMAAGRDFNKADVALMDTSNNGKNFKRSYIINETAARSLGFARPEDAVGKPGGKDEIPGVITGVVKDFNFASLHQPIGPLMLFLDNTNNAGLFVRTTGGNTAAVIDFLKKTWNERIPQRPFDYQFLDEEYDKLYTAEQKSVKIFSTFSTLAIVLACLGLFGLAAYSTLQRIREIGIRKVLGSSVSGIVMLIAKDFLRLTLIAIVVAVPAAWYFMNNWLKDFAFRVNLQWWVFAAAGLLALTIAFVTVGLQSVKAARMNPVKSLKGE
ncbi:MAG: ABC transporter permease [Chitinophagaceae bacterium]|nr:MAG: ABC transporter permease [Chitinophagaceae bacterium]